MKSVLIRGPLLSKSGYGVHSRQVFRYFLEKPNLEIFTEVLPWGITPWNIDDSDPIIGAILKRSAVPDKKFDISVQIQLPNEWDASRANYNIGVTAGVETDKCNPEWTQVHVGKMDKVIVPSNHARDTLVSNSQSAKNKTSVVRECYYDEIVADPIDLDLDLKTSFNFLTVGVMTGASAATDRKNLFFLIKWFCENFKDKPDVGLIIKTNRGRETAIDRHATKKVLKQVLDEISWKGSPKIYQLHGSMSRREMNGLYKHPDVKAFISLTRGEGFGLPHLEAAASGLPIIATNWSAHKEFLDLGKWIKVDYSLEKVDQSRIDDNIFMPGAKWAFPSESNFKKLATKFYENSEKPKEWAKELQGEILREYSWHSIREQYEKLLGEILD